jgi:hypothetical protein
LLSELLTMVLTVEAPSTFFWDRSTESAKSQLRFVSDLRLNVMVSGCNSFRLLL